MSDIRALPSEAAKRAAIETISQTRKGVREGKPLEYRAGTGDLRDCRKCCFDTPGREDKPRFRLVYHVTSEDDVQVLAADVIAVGERAALAAYHEAALRLGGHPTDRVPADSDDEQDNDERV
ncbi:hypothetical protein [Cellulomonas sp. S1-8]|uniref:hypothetical protein n=1 Tax=Cellulomonas sp. S1-8 TaxID=2904790 RepID=UPI002243E7DE|nr:hypothetical protein [Cellulomonas sp. S1-8]UZN03790.1 hypothetical protein OKX07_02280 [Cellulomonas sp. S1-8]